MSRQKTRKPGDDTQLEVNFLQFLADRWPWLALGATLGLLVAVGYSMVAEERYQSTAQVLVLEKQAALAGHSGSNDVDFESASVSNEVLATHMSIMSSPKIISQALNKDGLFELESLQAELPEDVEMTETGEKRFLVGYVRANMEVDRGGDGRAKDAQVLRVSFEHSSPADSGLILTAVIDSYRAFVRQTVRDMSNEAADIIRDTSTDLEDEIEQRDLAYREFVKGSPLGISENYSSNPYEARIQEIEAELSSLRTSKADRRSRLDLIRSNAANATAIDKLSAVDSEDVARLTLLFNVDDKQNSSNSPSSALVYQATADALANSLSVGPNHPRMIESKAKLAELMKVVEGETAATNATGEGEIASAEKLAAAYEQLLENDLSEVEQREKEAISRLATERALAKEMVDAQLEQKQRLRELERAQNMYDAVVDRIGQIDLLGNYAGYVNDVLSPVGMGSKTWPNIPLLGALGALGGMMLGLAFGVLAELLDRSFRGPEDIQRELDAPILSHVPSLYDQMARAPKSSKLDRSLVAYHRTNTFEAESFRRLRTSIQHRMPEAEQSPVYLVTSANRGDGKSTLVSNLAVSLSNANKRVLLVDMDLRMPSIHKLFGLENELGVANVLAGKMPLEESIQNTEIPSLSVIAAGRSKGNPAELLPQPSLDDFILTARNLFDIILIDTPPVLAVSDAVAIAPKADCTLLSLQSTDRRDLVQSAYRELTDSGANVLGLVVNTKKRAEGARYYQRAYNSPYASAVPGGSNGEYHDSVG